MALVYMAAHFCFLMWVYGHLTRRCSRPRLITRPLITTYNAEARAVQAGNEKIAEAPCVRSPPRSRSARGSENDTVYQSQESRPGRRADLSGPRPRTNSVPRRESLNFARRTCQKPARSKPADSSADYLTRWDSTIRLANFGELALAIFTLIFIRVRSLAHPELAPRGRFPV